MGWRVVSLGSSHLEEQSRFVRIQCVDGPYDDGSTEEVWGECAVIGQGGITAKPFPATDEGRAYGLVVDGVAGHEGVLVGWRDSRCTKVYGEIQPGDTVLHGTGPNHQSQVRCGEQYVAVMVGNDVAINVDRKKKKIQISGFGHMFEMSDTGGISMFEKGGAGICAKDGKLALVGAVVAGGIVPNPALMIATGTAANIAAAGLAPAKGVFIGG